MVNNKIKKVLLYYMEDYPVFLVFLKRILFSLLLTQIAVDATESNNNQGVPSNNTIKLMEGIVKVNDSLYYQDLLNEKIRLIIERLDDNNEKRWKELAELEMRYGFEMKTTIANEQKIKLSGHPLDGARHFKMVLDKVNRSQNQVWIAYITDDLRIPFQSLEYREWEDSILYCMTVVTSPEALITSHMGINKTINGSRKNFRGSSLRLHSLAAKVMLSLNPHRRFMINAPAWVMESIIADALPGGLYAGTREMKEELDRIANMSLNSYLKTEEGIAEKNKLIESGYQEEKKLLDKLKKSYSSRFPDVERKGGKKESLWEFMNQNPPIISLGHNGKTMRGNMVIYEAPNREKVFLTISNDNKNIYQWMFTEPFQALGETHYIAVDLEKLAQK